MRLGDIFNLQAGKFISASEIYSENDDDLYPCYGGNGLRGFVRQYNRNGAFPLIGRQGALCGNINFAQGKFYATEHAVVVETFANVSVKWAIYFLIQINLNQYATATAQPGLSVNKINLVYIPLPPLNEQHRIVTKIEELLPFIDQYDQKEQALTALNKNFPEQLKKSILQAAIQGKLTEQLDTDEPAIELVKRIQAEKLRLISEKKLKKPKGQSTVFDPDNLQNENVPFEIPENWVWVRLGDIVFNTGQKTPNKKFFYIDVGLIDNKNHKLSQIENIIDPENAPSRARKLVKNGSILYSTVRPYLQNVCIIDEEFKYEPIASTAFAVMNVFSGVYNKFLFYYLLSPAFTDFVNQEMIGVAYPAINDEKLFNFIVPLPPLTEQYRIVEKIELLLKQIDHLS